MVHMLNRYLTLNMCCTAFHQQYSCIILLRCWNHFGILVLCCWNANVVKVLILWICIPDLDFGMHSILWSLELNEVSNCSHAGRSLNWCFRNPSHFRNLHVNKTPQKVNRIQTMARCSQECSCKPVSTKTGCSFQWMICEVTIQPGFFTKTPHSAS